MPHMLLNSEDNHGLSSETTFRDHTLSELTFSGSAGSRKRTCMESRDYGSSVATTSVPPPVAVVPPFIRDVTSTLYSQNVEIDALIQFQTKQLHSGIELLSRKHSKDLVSAAEQELTKQLRIKEIELEYVSERNRELEEHAKQMAAESQVWFHYAMTTEAVVTSMRAKIDQVLINRIPCSACGDSYVVDEAESGCEPDESRRSCRVCQEREACVLLLPCRHLSVCKSCEANIEDCPVCNSTRNASIQVIVS